MKGFVIGVPGDSFVHHVIRVTCLRPISPPVIPEGPDRTIPMDTTVIVFHRGLKLDRRKDVDPGSGGVLQLNW